MAGLDNQPVDTVSSQASGLTSRFKGSMNVHRAVVSVPQQHCIHQLFFLYFTSDQSSHLQSKQLNPDDEHQLVQCILVYRFCQC